VFTCDGDSIRVDVPVGQLLSAPQEFNLSVDRDDAGPLAVKVRLIPASSSVETKSVRGVHREEMSSYVATTTYTGRAGRDSIGEVWEDMEYGAGD
jgi:hypothetical protein